MKTEDRISLAIEIGFTVFYAVALFINAIKSIAGIERLAVWHYGFFALTVMLTWDSVPAVTRCRFIVISRHIVKEVAQLTIRIHSRAVRSLAALIFTKDDRRGAQGSRTPAGR